MNITFLLGNGFDIQCGLQTSYIHFYEYILKKKIFFRFVPRNG
ncbi:AbiH family protein [Enterococcus sp. DIV0087]